jgi:hypothetical protein
VLVAHGVTDPAVVARLDDLLGSLRKDQRLLAALALFQEGARLDRLTIEQALEVAAFLRGARYAPPLRGFVPPSGGSAPAF